MMAVATCEPRSPVTMADKAREVVATALGHRHRLAIVQVLTTGALPVGDLCLCLHLAQPVVSKHLAVLRALQVVEYRQDGTQHIYAFAPTLYGDYAAAVGAALNERIGSPGWREAAS